MGHGAEIMASENLQAVVNDLIALPGGDDLTHGLFNDTIFFKKMADKNDHYLGGAKVKVPFQFAKHTASRSSTPYIAGATTPSSIFTPMEFDLWHFSASDLISEVEIEQSSDAEGANLLKSKTIGVKYAIKDDINLAMLTANGVDPDDAEPDFQGVPAIWETVTTYGGKARPTVAVPGNYRYHLAATAAYDPAAAEGGMVEFGGGGVEVGTAELFETRWDCSNISLAASAAANRPELAMRLINSLYEHITDASDNGSDILIICASDVYSMGTTYLNSKQGQIQWGMAKSLTASGGNKEGMTMNGAEFVKDRAMPAGSCFILNLKYLHYGTVDGFAPKKFEPIVEKRPDLVRQQQISGLVSLAFFTTNGTRQGWLQGLNELQD